MTRPTHPQLVRALVKNPDLILETLTPYTADLWHGATGVAGESGELLEAFLHPPADGIDRVNVKEELGDLYFYIEQLVQRTSISIDWVGVTLLAQNSEVTLDVQLRTVCNIAIHGSQVLDTVKKAAIYNKPLDTELLTNQLHALLVSMAVLGIMCGLKQAECTEANIDKLLKRYEGMSYSDKAAQERADKPEEKARKFFGDERRDV